MNWKEAIVPSLPASPRGGVAASSKNVAQPPKQPQSGWFSFLFLSENHPGLANCECLAIFFLLARPSLLAVMQGGDYCFFVRYPSCRAVYDRPRFLGDWK